MVPFSLLLTQTLPTSRYSLMALELGISPIPTKKKEPQSFPTMSRNTTLSLISDSAVLTITAPENILHKVDIDLAMGDVDLGTLSLDELDLELAMGERLCRQPNCEGCRF